MVRSGNIARRTVLGFSLLLCVSAVALWIRSHFISDQIAYNSIAPNTGRCREYKLRADLGLARFGYTLRTFDQMEGLEVFEHDLPFDSDEKVGWSVSQHLPASYDRRDSLLAEMGFWGGGSIGVLEGYRGFSSPQGLLVTWARAATTLAFHCGSLLLCSLFSRFAG